MTGETEARRALFQAARAFAQAEAAGGVEEAFSLVESAKAYALAAGVVAAPAPARPAVMPRVARPPAPGGGLLVVPFGAAKGKPLSEATPRELEWLVTTLEASVADPAKAQWATKNTALLSAVRAELAAR